jgi:hypothetical protein
VCGYSDFPHVASVQLYRVRLLRIVSGQRPPHLPFGGSIQSRFEHEVRAFHSRFDSLQSIVGFMYQVIAHLVTREVEVFAAHGCGRNGERDRFSRQR